MTPTQKGAVQWGSPIQSRKQSCCSIWPEEAVFPLSALCYLFPVHALSPSHLPCYCWAPVLAAAGAPGSAMAQTHRSCRQPSFTWKSRLWQGPMSSAGSRGPSTGGGCDCPSSSLIHLLRTFLSGELYQNSSHINTHTYAEIQTWIPTGLHWACLDTQHNVNTHTNAVHFYVHHLPPTFCLAGGFRMILIDKIIEVFFFSSGR